MVQTLSKLENRILYYFLFTNFPQLEPEVVEELCRLWTKKISLKKGERLEADKENQSHLYFIQKGCLKIAQESSENEIVFGFGWDNHCIFNLPKFLNHSFSESYIEAVKNSELLAISKNDFQLILNSSAILSKLWQDNLNQILLERIEREALFMHGKPAERVQWLFKRYPNILSKVPQVHIAAFLGIRQETLSRLLNLD